ncbi:MAG: TolB-like 6-bladed beta-propeller domain-containing protein [Bacteroidales bacterium]|jgi:hypothetical protein|nr:TolB-like 6-bladed beta-propeller domain-containing protein [Bacteroidales bacterium]
MSINNEYTHRNELSPFGIYLTFKSNFMQMKQVHVLFILFLLLSACAGRQDNKNVTTTNEEKGDTVKMVSPLISGESFYKEKDPFNGIKELTGTNITGDTAIFKIGETEMLVKGNYLIAKNRYYNGDLLMLFSLPDLKLIKTFGRSGKGPGELMYPHLVKTDDPDLLCYVFESTSQQLYSVDYSGKMQLMDMQFTDKKGGWFSDKQIVHVGGNTFLYVESSSNGKSIFHTEINKDSTQVKEIYSLSLNPKQKSWTAYMGDFAVNTEKDRMVYAYKYFKIVKFMDMNADSVRTINFERNTFDDTSPYRVDGMDGNITHYWGICSQPDYVYILYSGRTPYDVSKEWQKHQYYIFVEQYDWDGNPIQKMKLDRWGYFTVDEERQQIILASLSDDDPFLVYSIPEPDKK